MNNNTIPCGLEDERCRFESSNLDHARAVEDYADNLMADCKRFELAECINLENSLYDGDLLPRLMVEIANWTGRSDSAAQIMHALNNLLADELHKIAEREVA